MKRTPWRLTITLAAAVAMGSLFLAGCTKSDSQSEPAKGTNPPVQTTNQPAPAALPTAPGTNQAAQKAAATVQYTCSMHPDVVQDKPGDCPKCGMKLTEKR